MKKTTLIFLLAVFSLAAFAQEKLYIHKTDHTTLGAPVSSSDTIYYSADKTRIYISIGGNQVYYALSHIDSLSFGPASDTVFITYNDSWVTVVNPLAFEGVDVAVNGSDVTVTNSSETKDINYCLSGTASNGTFKIYSGKRYNLLLNGVNITNSDGPAINCQSGNKATVVLMDGTTNRLTDGATYATAPDNGEGEEEDQKGAFFSEGTILIKGAGSLVINGIGTDKHAVGSDDDIEIENGSVTVTSAANDGIHAKNGFTMSGGSLNITAAGDGIDGDEGYLSISGGTIDIACSSEDVSGIKSDSAMTVSGGTITVTVSGNQSKGLKCNQPMAFSGGTITVNAKGGAALVADGSGYDPAYCTAVKCDGNITVNGAEMTLNCTGAASRGISTDMDFSVASGNLSISSTGSGATYKNSSGTTDVYHAVCITADGAINLTGGTITTTSSGSGGRGINCSGALTIGSTEVSPVISVTTTGTSVAISQSDKAEAKAFESDGAFTVNNGNITISSADDGIKSTNSITFNGGTVSITKSVEGVEGPIINVNGGSISIVSSDDSFNATRGNGSEADDNSQLNLNGGNIVLSATTGDPLDSNGDLSVKGGTILVHGPQSNPEVGMDVNGTKIITGGFIIISGPSSNMTETFDNTSTQNSVFVKSQTSGGGGGGGGGGGSSQSGIFRIQDASGNDIVTFKPARSYGSIVFSSATLVKGATYSIYVGGISTGTEKSGLYTGGTYSGGTLKKSFTVSGSVTTVQW